MKKRKRKNYKVLLHRSYIVEVDAKSESEAKRYTEYFIGNPSVLITEKEREKFGFNVTSMEMTYNEVSELL